uniref:Putative chlorophyll synthesis pathway n=1 Tax=uncultured bacterium scaffold00090 TaxID=1132476 RepID=I6ZMA5_9BACT|nr:putative chlorophyll synthesis pathway [uncultured bacterium scaffold00090]
MRSAIYLGKEQVEVRDVPTPSCGKNDILVKNLYSSICGTDVAVYAHGPGTGHRITVGSEFGHETVSQVVEIGENVTDIKVGDIIYPYPLYAKNDTSRAGTLGGFSEYMLLPEATLNHSYYLVDPAIRDRTACLIEPFTVGGRAAKQAHPEAKDKAVVFGCGTIGIAAAIMLKYLGLAQVMVCDHSDFRLSIAKELGFEVCNTGEVDFTAKALQYFGTAYSIHGETADIDIWIDAVGADFILDSFMKTGKIDARFVMVAVNNGERKLNLLSLTYSSQSIIGSGGYRPEDVGDVMAIMRSGRWDIEKIITDEYNISDIDLALRRAGDAANAFNVIVRFD